MTSKEIRAQIRDHKREMKASGIPVRCSMNRMEISWVRANTRLEALKLDLERVLKMEAAAS